MRYLIPVIIIFLSACGTNTDTQKQRFLIRGNDALQQQNFREATRFFNEAINLDSCYTAAINNLGIVYFRTGQYHKAELEYTRALACDPAFMDAYMNRANAFYELNELFRALDDLEYVEKHIPDSATVHFRKGLVKTKMRKYEEALNSFDRAFELDTTNEETLINRGTVKYYMGNFEGAQNDLNAALKRDPLQANAYNALSLIEVEKENYTEAMDLVNRALELEPGQPYFLNNRGFIYLMQGDEESAKNDIDRSITIDPNNGWAYRNKGWYYFKNENYEDAVRLLERAVKLDPFVSKGYLFLAQAYFQLGEMKLGCQALREAGKNKTMIAEELMEKCR
ncbi:tetratricopeptide repeat protein [Fulvivirga sp. 29W222]|uniref:Tetratricopeptide repeat protein n=1 Tax=Fulvivirga marina TaxID=2494733 RepID=A0A937G221_9BACT|nr:tetratricopeptide repeat protein [Fulvivirga marina]MBL6449242.1 tetratricopeptide repeat protein [Fulvivirga marina]